MCWYHMRTNAEKNLSLIKDQDTRKAIMNDIDALQLAPSERIFDAASKLFIKKWKHEKEYIEYFDKEWIKVII